MDYSELKILFLRFLSLTNSITEYLINKGRLAICGCQAQQNYNTSAG